jgi:hypothetical protein
MTAMFIVMTGVPPSTLILLSSFHVISIVNLCYIIYYYAGLFRGFEHADDDKSSEDEENFPSSSN